MSSTDSTTAPEPSNPVVHRHPRVAIKLLALVTLASSLAIGLGVGFGLRSSNKNNKNEETTPETSVATTSDENQAHDQQDSVSNVILPFLEVDILEESPDSVRGTMDVIQDREFFTFSSEQQDTTMNIVFQCDKDKAIKTNEMDGWCGVEWKAEKDSNLQVTLSRYDIQDTTTIVFAPDTEISSADEEIMESFMASKLSEYYIGLTFKLGAMGKTGAVSPVYAHMHGEAQWLFSMALKDEYVRTNLHWDLGTQRHLDNGKRRGLHETTVVDDINRILTEQTAEEPSNMMSDSNIVEPAAEVSDLSWLDMNHDRNLGSCGQPYSQCGNPCFGRCGPDCTCWSWKCGSCGCWDGCRKHDNYCSCKSLWHFWCINVFWVGC